MRIKNLFFIGAFLFALILIVMLVTHLFYIGEIITKGSAYGFDIGTSKQFAFEILLEKANCKEITYISYFSPKSKNKNELSIIEANDNEILSIDTWQLRMKSWVPVDNLQLKFENDSLIEIYRHRDLFEVP